MMKRRTLSFIMAVVLVLSMTSGMTLREETDPAVPSPASETVQQSEATGQDTVSGQPEKAAEPAETTEPAVKPEAAEDPNGTADPEATEDPEVTVDPELAGDTDDTEDQEIVGDVDDAEDQDVTEDQDGTADPEVTDEPEATEEPGEATAMALGLENEIMPIANDYDDMIVGDELALNYVEAFASGVDSSQQYVFYINVRKNGLYYPTSTFNREFEARKGNFEFKLSGPQGDVQLGDPNVGMNRSMVWWSNIRLEEGGQYTLQVTCNGKSSSVSAEIVKVTFHPGNGTFDGGLGAGTYVGFGMEGNGLSSMNVPNSRSADGQGRLGWTSDRDGANAVIAVRKDAPDLYAKYGTPAVSTSYEIQDKDGTQAIESYTFKPFTLGEEPESYLFKVKNTGTEKITGLTAVTVLRYFDIQFTAGDLEAGDTRMMTITPKKNLTSGTYTETLMLSGSRRMRTVKLTVEVHKSGEFLITLPSITKEYGEVKSHGDVIGAGEITIVPEVEFDALYATIHSDGFAATAGVKSQPYPYTVSSTAGYTVKVESGGVTVTPAMPSGSPTASDVSVGQPLTSSSLSCEFTNPYSGEPVNGTLTWDPDENDPAQVVEGANTGHWIFTPSDRTNYKVAEGTVTVQGVALKPTTVTVEESQKNVFTYDGRPHSMAFKTNRPDDEGGTVEVRYRLTGQSDWTTEAPKNAGVYDVEVSVSASKNYAAHHEVLQGKLTIEPLVASFNYSVIGKIYDGSDRSELSSVNVKVGNRCGNDVVNANIESAIYESASAGSRNVAITVSGLSGSDAGNYKMPDKRVLHTTATISPRVITLSANGTIEKEYGDTVAPVASMFNADDLAAGESVADLQLSFVCDGTAYNAEPGQYTITATLQKGNYTLRSGITGASTAQVGSMTVTKAVPRMSGDISAGSGKRGDRLDSVTLSGEFVNRRGEKVPGTFTWEQPATVLGSSTEYPWIFTIDAEDPTVRDHYAFDKQTQYTYRGTAAVQLEDDLPIPIQVESESEMYNGEAHTLESYTVGDEMVTSDKVDVKVEYAPHGTSLWSLDGPKDVGVYDVQITAAPKQAIPGYCTNVVKAELIIIPADPETKTVAETLVIPQGTPLDDDLAARMGWPASVDGEPLEGTYIWTETGKVDEDGQIYNWTFTPRSNNYNIVTGQVRIFLAPDNRTLTAEVYNLPEEQNLEDYAIVAIPGGDDSLKAGDVICFYNGTDNPVSSSVTVSEADVDNGYVRVDLDEDALGNDASTLTVKIVSSTMNRGSVVQCPAEASLTVNQENIITAYWNYPVEMPVTLLGGYDDDITAVSFSVDSEDFIAVRQKGDTRSLLAEVTGLQVEHAHITVTATLLHPDQERHSGVTYTVTLQVHVNVTIKPGSVEVEVEPKEDAPKVAPTGTLEDKVLTEADKAQVEKGADVTITLEVSGADAVPGNDKTLVSAFVDQQYPDYTVGQYLDVSLFKTIGSASREEINHTAEPITLVITVPEDLRAAGRTFRIIRVHDGAAEVLNDLDSEPNTITFQTDLFSTYAIVYTDKAPENTGSATGSGGKTAPQTGDGSMPGLWLALLAMGMGGLAVCGMQLRRKKRSR